MIKVLKKQEKKQKKLKKSAWLNNRKSFKVIYRRKTQLCVTSYADGVANSNNLIKFKLLD